MLSGWYGVVEIMLSGWYGVVEIKAFGGSWLAMHCLQILCLQLAAEVLIIFFQLHAARTFSNFRTC